MKIYLEYLLILIFLYFQLMEMNLYIFVKNIQQ